MPPFIKVCGQSDPAAAACAAALGARWVGFIFHQGSPRCVTPEQAVAIPTPGVGRVGVFVRQGAGEILEIARQARLDFIQLHGRQTQQDAQLIGPQRVVRVLWPEHCGSPQELQRQIDEWAPYCAYYLLDAGSYGQAGGQGRRLDCSAFAALRFPHPWLLAGGLHAGNLAEVLSQCSPDGLDLNSGVESAPGVKDPALLRAAFAAAGMPQVQPQLLPVHPADLPQMKADMQQAFQLGYEASYGPSETLILPEKDIDYSLGQSGAVAYKAVVNGIMAGCAIVALQPEKSTGHLDFLYVKHGLQGLGVGLALWQMVEARHPEIRRWETCTPYFDRRNIHFYVNLCGFRITEFFHSRHPMPDAPDDFTADGGDGMFAFLKELPQG